MGPEALASIPKYVTSSIATTDVQGPSSATASRVYIGYWPDLVIGMRRNITVDVLKERYADQFMYGFLLSARLDAAPVRASSFAMLRGIVP